MHHRLSKQLLALGRDAAVLDAALEDVVAADFGPDLLAGDGRAGHGGQTEAGQAGVELAVGREAGILPVLEGAPYALDEKDWIGRNVLARQRSRDIHPSSRSRLSRHGRGAQNRLHRMLELAARGDELRLQNNRLRGRGHRSGGRLERRGDGGGLADADEIEARGAVREDALPRDHGVLRQLRGRGDRRLPDRLHDLAARQRSKRRGM